MKRTVDIILSLLLIILTFPFQLIIAAVLLIIVKDNPLFFHPRGLTLDTYRFTMIKFRTMPSFQIERKNKNRMNEVFLMPKMETHLNAFACWLRKSGLDELPQIYNILLGEMSFIGPRPLMIKDLEILKAQSSFYYNLREKIISKPGITGIWQIIGDRSRGAENLVGLDLFYEEKKSSLLDLIILFSTIPMILFAKNSDERIPDNDFISKIFITALEYFRFAPSKELLPGKHE
ncbi:MAG: sugar transferase [Ignavibacteriales bacterium]|nr:sugar transferase [Ignavibacteriales bacterium]